MQDVGVFLQFSASEAFFAFAGVSKISARSFRDLRDHVATDAQVRTTRPTEWRSARSSPIPEGPVDYNEAIYEDFQKTIYQIDEGIEQS